MIGTVTIDAKILAMVLPLEIHLSYNTRIRWISMRYINLILAHYWICSEVDKSESGIHDKLELRPLYKFASAKSRHRTFRTCQV